MQQNRQTGTRKCDLGLSVVQKAELLGQIPRFTFELCASNDIGSEARFDPFGVHEFTERCKLPELPDQDCGNLADALMKDETLSQLAKENFTGCPKLNAAQKLALFKCKGYFNPLYLALGRNTAAKMICLENLEPCLEQMRRLYSDIKSEVVIDAAADVTLSDHAANRERLGLAHTWPKKLYALSGQFKGQPASYYDPKPVQCHSIRDHDWIGAMTYMAVVRKSINATHARNRRSIWHMTILDFGPCFTMAINQKTSQGHGTTRMVWPLPLNETGGLSPIQIRVLDMSYGDVAKLMVNELARKLGGDSRLAQAMLDVLHGNEGTIETLKKVKGIKLGQQRCAFLKGVRFKDNRLEIDERWWLSKKARSAFDLDSYGYSTTAYEAICNIMSILFIAEPRHALSMFPCTMIQLEEVANGQISLLALLGNADGAIQYGRLLAGANVLGRAPDIRESATQQLAKSTFNTIQDYVGGQHVDSTVVVECPRKSLAMPLADFYKTEEIDDFAHSHSLVGALTNDICEQPVYQPLLKVLFTELLRMIGNEPVPECADGVPSWSREGEPEKKRHKDRPLLEIEGEDDEHDGGVAGDDDDFLG